VAEGLNRPLLLIAGVVDLSAPRSEGMATYTIAVEGDGLYPVVRIAPAEKVFGHGPFSAAGDRELAQTLAAIEVGRARALGCRDPRGGLSDSWRLAFNAPRRDVAPVTAAIKAFLEGDDTELRLYVRSPPDLRAQPRPGESWDLVA
jgi:hypothetical protein